MSDDGFTFMEWLALSWIPFWITTACGRSVKEFLSKKEWRHLLFILHFISLFLMTLLLVNFANHLHIIKFDSSSKLAIGIFFAVCGLFVGYSGFSTAELRSEEAFNEIYDKLQDLKILMLETRNEVLETRNEVLKTHAEVFKTQGYVFKTQVDVAKTRGHVLDTQLEVVKTKEKIDNFSDKSVT